mgnify:CR=1 FL=1
MLILFAIVSGVIIGLLIGILLLIALMYFRPVIQSKLDVAKSQIEAKGPKGKGYLFEAQTDADVARQAIIDRNTAAGRDTTLKELQ